MNQWARRDGNQQTVATVVCSDDSAFASVLRYGRSKWEVARKKHATLQEARDRCDLILKGGPAP